MNKIIEVLDQVTLEQLEITGVLGFIGEHTMYSVAAWPCPSWFNNTYVIIDKTYVYLYDRNSRFIRSFAIDKEAVIRTYT